MKKQIIFTRTLIAFSLTLLFLSFANAEVDVAPTPQITVAPHVIPTPPAPLAIVTNFSVQYNNMQLAGSVKNNTITIETLAAPPLEQNLPASWQITMPYPAADLYVEFNNNPQKYSGKSGSGVFSFSKDGTAILTIKMLDYATHSPVIVAQYKIVSLVATPPTPPPPPSPPPLEDQLMGFNNSLISLSQAMALSAAATSNPNPTLSDALVWAYASTTSSTRTLAQLCFSHFLSANNIPNLLSNNPTSAQITNVISPEIQSHVSSILFYYTYELGKQGFNTQLGSLYNLDGGSIYTLNQIQLLSNQITGILTCTSNC